MVKHIVKYVWRYMNMKPIEVEKEENLLLNYKNKDIYVNIENTKKIKKKIEKHKLKKERKNMNMKKIKEEKVENLLLNYKNKDIYVHLETTNGAYASHFGNQGVNVGAYIRNAKVKFIESDIKG